ncbi:uncharacterized protein JCM6883_006515 [Sporobolomyces salmoneus]|uniref:uncharacterized protein n=1 Tax=Sporobolomyces salmoneus TaxID=183962 RepID=UPI00317A05FD
MLFSSSEWKLARAAKDEERFIEIEQSERLVERYADRLNPELEAEILASNAAQIVESIKSKKAGWNATNVMLTFIKSAIASQKRCNNLTEILFSPALKTAMDLDEEFEKTGQIKGPLHGVPVSFKDQIDIKGVDSTMGFTHQKNHPPTADATLVSIVRASGGIPLAKTNVPQTMLSFECANPLFGITRNPYDPERISGGSSGGEAALLASDGSALGFGSDVGGSLRIPCHFSGCFALKPTTQRYPSKGCRSTNHGFDAIKSSMGPMGRSVEDVELLTKVVFERVKAEGLGKFEEVRSAGYQQVELQKKLKFGYYLTDGFCHASPACSRAVLETVEALRKQGHEVVEIPSPNAIEAMEIFVALTSANGYEPLLANLMGDPQESSLFLVTIGPKLPWFLRSLLGYIAENWLGDDKMARLLRASRRKSALEMQAWQHKRDEYVTKFRKEVFQDNNLDFVLCSTQATPALKHGQTWDLSPLAIGTILYNVVDSAVGLIPVTRVSPTLDALTPEFYDKISASSPTRGSKLVEGRVYGASFETPAVKRIYDAEEMEGLPVGIQLVGGWGEEEKVIEGMKVVDKALGQREFGPGKFAKRVANEKRVY